MSYIRCSFRRALGGRPGCKCLVVRSCIGAALYLVDDGVRHECTYGMVAARNQIDSKVFAPRAENDGLIHCAVVEEANKQQLTLKHDPSFRFWRVEMTVRSRVTS